MTQHHDDPLLQRLAAADPAPDPVSHPDDARVRATLQEILMTDTLRGTPRDNDETTSGQAATPWFRSPRILAVAAALLLVVGVAGAALVGGSDDGDATDVATLPTAPGDDDAAPTDDVFPDGEPNDGALPTDAPQDLPADSQVTSCVELYSPETLPNRTHAFDGTVTAVEGQDMTFEVNEWFTPGPYDPASTTVTLDHQGYLGMLFAPDGPALEPGTRVLVAGDGGFVWSCGFTQLHDTATAEVWRSATSG